MVETTNRYTVPADTWTQLDAGFDNMLITINMITRSATKALLVVQAADATAAAAVVGPLTLVSENAVQIQNFAGTNKIWMRSNGASALVEVRVQALKVLKRN